ncbi:NUDIX hydrolase [Paenibacillus sp. NPDC058071]|uniref:NUDIX hydrolase n=1 Tax=Paenibacillus sp. NPDC058071 TaxID=3346326 RepID=UPI0036DF885A
MEIKWLEWAKQIQAISQSGLAYVKDPYDKERYEQLRALSVEMLSHYTTADTEQIRLAFASDRGYATPKVDVRAVVFQDDKLLFVKERSDGAWALPGGWADIGYTPAEVAVKEVKEESGYDTEALRLLAVFDKKRHDHPPDPFHVYKIFILCRLVGGQAQTSIETSEVGFFGEDQLPELSASRNTEAQIRLMFDYYKNPGIPVAFD